MAGHVVCALPGRVPQPPCRVRQRRGTPRTRGATRGGLLLVTFLGRARKVTSPRAAPGLRKLIIQLASGERRWLPHPWAVTHVLELECYRCAWLALAAFFWLLISVTRRPVSTAPGLFARQAPQNASAPSRRGVGFPQKRGEPAEPPAEDHPYNPRPELKTQ